MLYERDVVLNSTMRSSMLETDIVYDVVSVCVGGWPPTLLGGWQSLHLLTLEEVTIPSRWRR